MFHREKLIAFGMAMMISMAVLADNPVQQTIDKLQQQIQSVSELILHNTHQAQSYGYRAVDRILYRDSSNNYAS